MKLYNITNKRNEYGEFWQESLVLADNEIEAIDIYMGDRKLSHDDFYDTWEIKEIPVLKGIIAEFEYY